MIDSPSLWIDVNAGRRVARRMLEDFNQENFVGYDKKLRELIGLLSYGGRSAEVLNSFTHAFDSGNLAELEKTIEKYNLNPSQRRVGPWIANNGHMPRPVKDSKVEFQVRSLETGTSRISQLNWTIPSPTTAYDIIRYRVIENE